MRAAEAKISFQQWKQRLEVSQSQIKAREDEWDALWEQYLPNISRSTVGSKPLESCRCPGVR